MEDEEISEVDLNPVARQLVGDTGVSEAEGVSFASIASWAVLGLSVLGACGAGLSIGTNPTDQAAACLSWLPVTLIAVPVWALGAALIRRGMGLPVQTPVALCGALVLLWVWAQYLVRFEVLYRLEPTGPLSGIYVVRWGIAILLGLLVLLSLVAAVYMTWTTARGLRFAQIPISEVREPPTTGRVREKAPVVADEILSSEDAIYEAQLLLLNLGYEIDQVDGEVDITTRSALKKIQVMAGLSPSGEVTQSTLDELRRRANLQIAPTLSQTAHIILAHIGRSAGDWARLWWQRRHAG